MKQLAIATLAALSFTVFAAEPAKAPAGPTPAPAATAPARAASAPKSDMKLAKKKEDKKAPASKSVPTKDTKAETSKK